MERLIEPCLGVVTDGVLWLGRNNSYKVPCADGKFTVFSFGNGTLLLAHYNAGLEQQILSPFWGKGIFEDRVHIQGCILKCERIRKQSHTLKKEKANSMLENTERQECMECQRHRKKGKGCNSFRDLKRTLA